MAQLGNNVEATVEGDKLTLVIDLTRDLGLSKSRKTRMVASTNGNQSIGAGEPGGDIVFVGVNVYKRK